MPQEFGPNEELDARAKVEAEELIPLLERLHDPHAVPEVIQEEQVTVQDVAEATGLPINEVLDALAKVRDENHEARLAAKLRELEEPMYRVERPGPSPVDPLSTLISPIRRKDFSSILDHLPKFDPNKIPLRRTLSETPHEKSASVVAQAILWTMFFLLVAVMTYGLYRLIR
ncbi:MAG: hypothetical protein K1X67_18235 [Fimbriimonadaceae bacterium]|nr:hypothetical protein [Fimbriimonadaceae bacterium]